MTEGETPIIKNIAVIDEEGTVYEATYPRRAKGLVKNGRARFIDEFTICLARPPIDSQQSEDVTMEETNRIDTLPECDAALSAQYIVKKIDEILQDKQYILDAIRAVQAITPNTSVNGGFGDQARAESLGKIVAARESTHQKLLDLLSTMYEDFRPGRTEDAANRLRVLDLYEQILDSSDLNGDEKRNLINSISQ